MPPGRAQSEAGAGSGAGAGASDWRPIPDPTTLTNQAVAAAVEMMRRELRATQEKIEGRFDGIDKLHTLFDRIIDHFPANAQKQTNDLKDLIYETLKTIAVKFDAVNTEFALRDERVKENAAATQVAVNAAFQAADKVVQKQYEAFAMAAAKAEDASNKRIEAMERLIQTEARGLNDKLTDSKERLTRIEAMGLGRDTSEKRTQDSSAHTIAIVAAGVGLIGLMVAVIAMFLKAH